MDLNQAITDRYALYNGDCCQVMPTLPDKCVDLSVYSPPFCGLTNQSPFFYYTGLADNFYHYYLKDFDQDFNRLSKMLSEILDADRVRQSANLNKFFERVLKTMQLCNCDRYRAIEIIADAEGELEAFQFYGYERLEWVFDLRFGSIKEALEGGTE